MEDQQIQQQQIQQQNQQQNYKKGKKSVLLLVLLLLLVTVTIGYAVLSTSLNILGTSEIVSTWCVGLRCNCEDLSNCENPPIVCPNHDCVIKDCDAHPDQCNCNAVTGECAGPTKPDCTKDPDKSDSTKCSCTAGGVCTEIAPIWVKGDTINFRHTLTKPGQVFTYDVTYENGGSIDAKLSSFSKSTLNATAQQFMTYDVKYSDGSNIVENETLNAGQSKTYRVTVTYKNVSTLPTAAQLDLINEVADGRNGASSEFTATYVQK